VTMAVLGQGTAQGGRFLPVVRTGFTTGACAAAAARAAARALLVGTTVSDIAIELPNGALTSFAVARCERLESRARCSVVKDAGDDPDCTDGAEIVAEVELRDKPGIELTSGGGIAKVTRRGLGLEVGTDAINPVPRRNIAAMVSAELAASVRRGALVILSVPGGEEMARATLNGRLGLVGGISILGTTGVVRPFSCAAFQKSIAVAIDVACAEGQGHVVLTTGGRTERFAMALLPHLEESAFVQVGDEVGFGLRHAACRGARQAVVVAMAGKLAKMAAGVVQTHVSRSPVDLNSLAALAARCGASAHLVQAIARANTARHGLELADAAGLEGFCELLCGSAAKFLGSVAGPALEVQTLLIGFDGQVRAAYPSPTERRSAP